MNDKINKYIENQIRDTKNYIITRAREYAEAFIVDDLFDIDCDKFPVSLYDMEDMNNHNYDLGRLKTLEELKNL
jgi:hypothetical protein